MKLIDKLSFATLNNFAIPILESKDKIFFICFATLNNFAIPIPMIKRLA